MAAFKQSKPTKILSLLWREDEEKQQILVTDKSLLWLPKQLLIKFLSAD